MRGIQILSNSWKKREREGAAEEKVSEQIEGKWKGDFYLEEKYKKSMIIVGWRGMVRVGRQIWGINLHIKWRLKNKVTEIKIK